LPVAQYALDGFLNAVAGLHTRPEEGEL